MKKKNKGFTLIELLAVIVILGLLMAIAIPSVTKYITESRKKTVTTTVGNYIGALVNEVNDLTYTFTAQNTIYAVPIECIALERGGTNPFGHWYQANDAYFAYVLVQYDDVNSKYVYGFTFKDSAGYGLYPTIQANISEKGTQIKTGYDLNKPTTGDVTSLTTLARWQESGFKVDSNTNLQVLEAASENEIGNGTSTCTLQQKGDNYAQVEEEKSDSVVLNKYNFYYDVPYRLATEVDGEHYIAELIFTKDEKIIINEYSDAFVQKTNSDVIDLKEVDLSYSDFPIKENDEVILGFSEDGRKAYFMGRTYYIPVKSLPKSLPTLNQYGFFYDTEYVLLNDFLGIDYLTIQFDKTGSLIAFFYTDDTYTTFYYVSEVEKNQYKYENGQIIQLSPSGTCCSNIITISNNGEQLQGCDCDLSYNSVVWYEYFDN